VVPLAPLAEEDGSIVSFDGRILKFRRAFKPLAGFDNVAFLGRALQQAGGSALELAGVRAGIAAAAPAFESLTGDLPNVYLDGGPKGFFLAPSAPSQVSAYLSATTFARHWVTHNGLK